MNGDKREFGTQPLDAFMIMRGLANTDVVRSSTQQLTHKMVAKARSGRRVTVNIQSKIFKALKTLFPEEILTSDQLFNY